MSMNVAKGRKFYDTGPWDCSQHYVIVFGATAFSTTAYRNSTLKIKAVTLGIGIKMRHSAQQHSLVS